MIKSIVLRIDNRIFTGRLSTYRVTKEVTYSKVITTIDGDEIYRGLQRRPIVTFSMLPYSDSTAMRDYEVLSQGQYEVVYTDTDTGLTETRMMRLVTNLEHVFLLDSINGKRYYRGGEITLRATSVI